MGKDVLGAVAVGPCHRLCNSDADSDDSDNLSDSEPHQSRKVGGRLCDKHQKGGTDEVLADLCH